MRNTQTKSKLFKPLDQGQSANGGSPFLVMFPVTVFRSVSVVSLTDKDFVSSSFWVTFSDGSQKLRAITQYTPKGLICGADLVDRNLTKEESPLYFEDWASKPLMDNIRR